MLLVSELEDSTIIFSKDNHSKRFHLCSTKKGRLKIIEVHKEKYAYKSIMLIDFYKKMNASKLMQNIS
jgi:hypothetical protein